MRDAVEGEERERERCDGGRDVKKARREKGMEAEQLGLSEVGERNYHYIFCFGTHDKINKYTTTSISLRFLDLKLIRST